MTEITVTQEDREAAALEAKFWSKVDRRGPDECWAWKPNPSVKGYGSFYISRRLSVRAHRMAFLIGNGPIPEGLVIDHLCRNRACCNPSHLRAISNVENVMIGEGLTAMNARKTHCKRGHELSGDNLVMNGKWRQCRECRRMQNIVDKTRLRRRLGVPIRSAVGGE